MRTARFLSRLSVAFLFSFGNLLSAQNSEHKHHQMGCHEGIFRPVINESISAKFLVLHYCLARPEVNIPLNVVLNYAKFDTVKSDVSGIRTEHYPNLTQVSRMVYIVRFDPKSELDEAGVFEELDRANLRPATARELLYAFAMYPEVFKSYSPVVSLQSLWHRPQDGRERVLYFPVLFADQKDPVFRSLKIETEWSSSGFRFAAVPKKYPILY